ncbi:Mucin-5B [Plecturocebus cupreus]
MKILGGLLDLRVPEPLLSPCRNRSPQLEGLVEGCFCPEDQILFNEHTGICVQACRKLCHLGSTKRLQSGRGRPGRAVLSPLPC